MNEPSYEVATSTDALCFDFESISAEKIIQKQVRFTAFPDAPTVFNMALIDIVNGGTDSDLTVSNNQDMRKVLATVGKCLIAFFDIYPRAVVVFSGSTQSRTRLYRVAITQNLSLIDTVWEVLGFQNDTFEPFVPNQPYQSFAIRLKKS
jgi:hypothetical protein